MKKILLMTILLMGYLKSFGQDYCIKISKVSEQNGLTAQIVLKFELTAATTPVSAEFYTIDILPLAGVQELGLITFINGANLSTKNFPWTLGTITFTKDGTPNIAFNVAISQDAPQVITGITLLNNDLSCNILDLTASLLPVEWLTFNASPINTSTGTKVALDWSTASEKDVKNFEVERSEEGKVFKKIGEEIAASNTAGNHNYSALDEKPLTGVSYYRIRQTDYDGKTSLTKIQSVNLSNGKSKSKFTFYPNPIHKGTPLSILTDVQGEYSFKVIDLTGRIVYNAQLQGNAELENLKLAGGTYMYQILSGDQNLLGKIFVAE